MATNPAYSYQGVPPGAQGEGQLQEEAAPPAFNPEALNPSDYAAQIPAAYGSIPTQIPQQAPIRQQIMQQAQYQPIPQQNIQYVNQYGQPLQNSPVIVVPPQQPQQTIIYAQQQNTALIPPIVYSPIHDYRNPSNKNRQKRFVAAVGGMLSCILLVSAMSSSTLASGTIDGYEYECSVLFVHTLSSDVSNNYAYYSDFCWNFDSDVNWENWDDTASSDWCHTWRAASYWISFIVFGCLMSCVATCWVQPLCTMERCCCPLSCPRVFYAFGLLLCILGNILWTTNDSVCLAEHGLGLQIGTSVGLVAGACVVIFCTLFCAK